MHPVWFNVAALAVALIFYVWKSHRLIQERRASRQTRRRYLRDRVTFMLWVMAEEVGSKTPLSMS
jgi:hypothetical protein